MELIRFFLYPFALIYGLVIFFRNKLFDWGILKSFSFPIPVIAVGNLSAGGSGKTPMVEYIARLLKDSNKTAILSRGYKRKTKGFFLATPNDNVEKLGDEPLQYAKKFSDVRVAVDESRKHGIEQLLSGIPDLKAVILDDAYQHRYVKPSLTILVTDYHKIYSRDHLLPVGRLREPKKNAERADIIVVSKTPRIFSPLVRRQLLEELNAAGSQLVCFSYISYEEWIPLFGKPEPLSPELRKVNTILLLTGIAFPAPMEEYLRPYCSELAKLEFRDHHTYTENDLKQVRDSFLALPTRRKLIVTTEKDAMRLQSAAGKSFLGELPVYYLPIRTAFHPMDKQVFDSAIKSVVTQKPITA